MPRLLVCLLVVFVIISVGCRSRRSENNVRTLKVSELSVTDPLFQDRLLRGFYEGTQGWKWTARQFAVSLDVPPAIDQPTLLDMDYQIPSELINALHEQAVHEVNITTRVNGTQVSKQKFTAEGRQRLKIPIPAASLKTSPAIVEVELDRCGKDAATGRDIGLIVVGLGLTYSDTAETGREVATEMARRGYEQLLKRRQLQMPQPQQQEMMKLFHQLPIWRSMWFQNVPIEKSPLDLWMMQQIIYETQPEFIVETGTFRGGSALYWAYTLHGMGLENSRVITIDVEELAGTASKHPLWKKYVTFMKGSSTDPAIVAGIAKRVKGHRVFVTLDSDHRMKHVLNELHAYSPLVSRGDYLIVEDTHIDGVPTDAGFGPGPMAAVLQFLKDGGSTEFEQDLSREAFAMTFQPGGWLRRK